MRSTVTEMRPDLGLISLRPVAIMHSHRAEPRYISFDDHRQKQWVRTPGFAEI